MNKSSSVNINAHFQITIAAYPSEKISLEQEFTLIKAALLYADRIKVFSPTATAIRMVEKIENLPPKLQVKFLERILPITSKVDEAQNSYLLINRYKHLLEKGHLNTKELVAKLQIEKILKPGWEVVKDEIQNIVEATQFKEFDKLTQLGLLDLHTFKGTDSHEAAINFMAECLELTTGSKKKALQPMDPLLTEFIEQIGISIQNPLTYPLFDDRVSSLVRAGVQANAIHPSEHGIERGKHVGLAKNLFDHLPLFEHATVNEILDIRKELDTPLTRFRKAMITYADDIKPASWDIDFAYDAEKVFYRDVQPAILEIEEAIKSNNYLALLARKFIDKPLAAVPGSLISIAMANFTSLPQEIALSIGIGVSSLAIIYDAYEEWSRKNQVMEQNLLYFYYQANKKLGS